LQYKFLARHWANNKIKFVTVSEWEKFIMNFPNQIESERIILERPYPVTKELAEEIYKTVMSSREHLHEWLPWATETYSLEDEMSYLKDYCEAHWENGEGFSYLIREKETKKFLGIIDLITVNQKHKSTEIGFWLAKDATGKGYMVEAVKALENEAFKQGLNRVVIKNDTQNIASANVSKNAGYHLDGVLRQERWSELKNRFRDTNVWSKLKSDETK